MGLGLLGLVVVAPGAGAEDQPGAVAEIDSSPSEPADPAGPTDPASPADPGTDPTPPVTPPPVVPPPLTPPAPPAASRLPLREGAVGWRVVHVQERLQWLGYEIFEGNLANERMGESTVAAVKRFQAKFGFRPTGVVGEGTYALLDEIAGKVGRLPAACTEERSICIDKTQRLVRFVEKGRVRLTLDARFGFVGAETREGSFRVHMKSRNHTSSLYRTWMPFALFFAGGQAVHYSPYFDRDGYNGASHGCVNLRDIEAAEWLFDQVPMGTRVHVYRS